jgi:membrane-anchored protein YejM (alkaline phosphatase superfamily)
VPLDAAKLLKVNVAFRKRAQAVQAVDAMIKSVQDALEQHGLTGDTYLVFTSDNGLHTGEYRLTPGKLTAYDTGDSCCAAAHVTQVAGLRAVRARSRPARSS